MSDTPLLRVDRLRVSFTSSAASFWGGKSATVRALDDVSFEIREGQTLALVGESGCGKSTVARAVLQLIRPESGSVFFEGVDLTKLSQKELRPIRKRLQIVFQDSSASLNPRMTVEETVSEPLIVHRLASRAQRRSRVGELLEQVGLGSQHLSRFPSELSGGQRQRVGIARALATEPRLLVCDEPTSALDVSVRAQVINLLADLQKDLKLAYLFISHDLSVVAHLSHQAAVMYLGRIVESGPASRVFGAPLHPYTRALLASIPNPDPSARTPGISIANAADAPSLSRIPSGCAFHPRCPEMTEICKGAIPAFAAPEPARSVACTLYS